MFKECGQLNSNCHISRMSIDPCQVNMAQIFWLFSVVVQRKLNVLWIDFHEVKTLLFKHLASFVATVNKHMNRK